MQGVLLLLQQLSVSLCLVNLLQDISGFQTNNQPIHLFPQQGAPLIQMAAEHLHLLHTQVGVSLSPICLPMMSS